MKESDHANNHFACPIVTSYPETIYSNVEQLGESGVKFMKPFLPLEHQGEWRKKTLRCIP